MTEELCFSAALLLAGEAPCAQQITAFLPPSLQQQLCWVAADGGCRLAQSYQVKLQAIIGDFDSAPADYLPTYQSSSQPNDRLNNQQSEQRHFCTDKNESDRNLGLEYLIEQGHRNIVQIGGGGGRSDHFLAMIYDYQLQRSPTLPKLWLTHCEAIFYLEAGEQLEFTWPQWDSPTPHKLEPSLLSAFPLSEGSRLYSEQLKWPLTALQRNITPQQATQGVTGQLPYSLSNWAVGQTAVIGVERGSALVFCPHPLPLIGEVDTHTNVKNPPQDHLCIFKLYKKFD